MSLERPHPPTTELDPQAVEAFASTFLNRTDLYALQQPDGHYTCVKEPLTPALVAAHLYGEITLGTYALNSRSQTSWLCLDADTPEQWDGIWRLGVTLCRLSVTPYLEASRRGGHLWLFFPHMSGVNTRAFGHALIASHGLDDVELFPKQDILSTGPGSLVRLPLGVHRKDGFRYYFLNRRGQPLAPTIRQQVDLLGAPDRVPEEFITEILVASPSMDDSAPASLTESSSITPPTGETLSQRIKASISTHDFIARYVELDPRGRGLCPFHADKHASFSVDLERNYWHCFAGCGGGSIIDFWMKWRETHGEDPNFIATLKDLAIMLL